MRMQRWRHDPVTIGGRAAGLQRRNDEAATIDHADLSCSGFVRPKPGRRQNGINACSLWQRIKTSGQACELHCSAFGQKISRSGFLSIHCSGFVWPKWSRSDRLALNMFSPRSWIAWVGIGDGKDASNFTLAVTSFGQDGPKPNLRLNFK